MRHISYSRDISASPSRSRSVSGASRPPRCRRPPRSRLVPVGVVRRHDQRLLLVVAVGDDVVHHVARPGGRAAGAEIVEDQDLGVEHRAQHVDSRCVDAGVERALQRLEQLTLLVEQHARALAADQLAGDRHGQVGLAGARAARGTAARARRPATARPTRAPTAQRPLVARIVDLEAARACSARSAAGSAPRAAAARPRSLAVAGAAHRRGHAVRRRSRSSKPVPSQIGQSVGHRASPVAAAGRALS